MLTLNILNYCAGTIVLAYFGYRFYTKQYSITDSLLEYCLSMHYDFKFCLPMRIASIDLPV